LLVKRGKAEAGIRLLRNAQAILHKARYELLTTAFNGTLAEALTMAGQFQQALALTDQTIAQVERGGDLFTMPELLRIKGDILASSPQPDLAQAETCLRRSLELAREQCALGWELRTATRLALLRSQQNRPRDAHDILAPVYDRFTEGFESADLKAAWKLLNELRSSASG
jgi:predicted ATPase